MQEGVKPRSGVLSKKAGTGVSASSMLECTGGVIWAGCSSSPATITAAIFEWTAFCFRALGGRETFVLQQLCHPFSLIRGARVSTQSQSLFLHTFADVSAPSLCAG